MKNQKFKNDADSWLSPLDANDEWLTDPVGPSPAHEKRLDLQTKRALGTTGEMAALLHESPSGAPGVADARSIFDASALNTQTDAHPDPFSEADPFGEVDPFGEEKPATPETGDMPDRLFRK